MILPKYRLPSWFEKTFPRPQRISEGLGVKSIGRIKSEDILFFFDDDLMRLVFLGAVHMMLLFVLSNLKFMMGSRKTQVFVWFANSDSWFGSV